MPPRNSNAIFLTDAHALNTEGYYEAYQEAARQGAFIFWNHPCWKVQQPDTVVCWVEHTRLYEADLMHGIEVVNAGDYCPKAHRWCIEKYFTMIGGSDLHFPASFVYTENQHCPMTLLLVREATPDGCREALLARRMLVIHNHTLLGFHEFLEPIVRACINLHSSNAKVAEVTILLFTITRILRFRFHFLNFLLIKSHSMKEITSSN